MITNSNSLWTLSLHPLTWQITRKDSLALTSLEDYCHLDILILSEPLWKNHSHKQTHSLPMKPLKTNQNGQDQRSIRSCKMLRQLRLKLKRKKKKRRKKKAEMKRKSLKRKPRKKLVLRKRKKNLQTGHQRTELDMLNLKTHTLWEMKLSRTNLMRLNWTLSSDY